MIHIHSKHPCPNGDIFINKEPETVRTQDTINFTEANHWFKYNGLIQLHGSYMAGYVKPI